MDRRCGARHQHGASNALFSYFTVWKYPCFTKKYHSHFYCESIFHSVASRRGWACHALQKRAGHTFEIAGPVFLQALVELWTAALWVVFAVFFVGSIGGWLGLVGFLSLLAILTTPLLFSQQLPHIFDILKKHGMTHEWIDKTRITFQLFGKLVSSKGKKNVWRFWMLVIGLGLSAHALSGGLIWYIARIEGAHVTLLQGIFAATMAALIEGILTVIPGGLGVTEGGLVGVLSSFAVSWHKTIVITLLYRLATLPLSIIIALLFLVSTYRTKTSHMTHVASTELIRKGDQCMQNPPFSGYSSWQAIGELVRNSNISPF